jgi:uncharacterized RDD family membrane protein YckC
MCATQTIVFQQTLASRGSRLGAVILDLIILLGAMAPGLLIFFSSLEEYDDGLAFFGLLLLIPAFLGIVIYNYYLLSKQGQTIGKLVVGIQIVDNDDGSNPGFVRAVALRGFVPSLIYSVPFAGGLFAIANILVIFGSERRCLHDYIAGTKVVLAGSDQAPSSFPAEESLPGVPVPPTVEELIGLEESPCTIEDFADRVWRLTDLRDADRIGESEFAFKKSLLISRLRPVVVGIDPLEVLQVIADLKDTGALSATEIQSIKEMVM